MKDNIWDKQQYYKTIQSIDIDGDGHAEILSRGVYGGLIWKHSI